MTSGKSACLAIAGLSIICGMLPAQVAGPLAGPSVNMVSGRQWPKGDPFLQRQNEPSIAVSTRNPLHLLAGANDYRSVDLPQFVDALPQGGLAADAWVGVFKSFDGAQTWMSDLHPGYPQDTSAEGTASPLKGFTTASDITVRAGTNGLFYYSGISFNRGGNGLGVLFVSRFSDYNNKENDDTIRRNGTSVIDSGTAGKFIDKPALATDVPRAGAQSCSIPAVPVPGEPGNLTFPAQSFPGGNVYVSYAVFVGGDAQARSKLMLARSTNCGGTWDQPIKISGICLPCWRPTA